MSHFCEIFNFSSDEILLRTDSMPAFKELLLVNYAHKPKALLTLAFEAAGSSWKECHFTCIYSFNQAHDCSEKCLMRYLHSPIHNESRLTAKLTVLIHVDCVQSVNKRNAEHSKRPLVYRATISFVQ